MMRRLLQPFWVLLAVIFLIEAWLWDHLEPIVERIVARIPLRAFKQWLSERVDTLSPAMTLIVFAVPVIPLFPLKLVGLWLLANEYWLSAAVVIVLGKFVGVGVTAFIFDVTRPSSCRWRGSRSSMNSSWRCAPRRRPWSSRSSSASGKCCVATATAGHRARCG